MDNIEITVFDEIKDYKEKIYFFNFRQWIFAILIIIAVVPTYLILKEKIGEEATSYIVIAIAGVLGFIGFVKIHELPAEKIMPFWFRHYLLFAKPIHYMTDSEYELQHQKKNKHKTKSTKTDWIYDGIQITRDTHSDKYEDKYIYYIPQKEKPFQVEITKSAYADQWHPIIEGNLNGVLYRSDNPKDSIIINGSYGTR